MALKTALRALCAVSLVFVASCAHQTPIVPTKPIHSNTKPFDCFECNPPITFGYCCPIVEGHKGRKPFEAVNDVGEKMYYCDLTKYNGQCDDGKHHYCPKPSPRQYVACQYTGDPIGTYLAVASSVDEEMCFNNADDANSFATFLKPLGYPDTWTLFDCGTNGKSVKYGERNVGGNEPLNNSGLVSNTEHAPELANYINALKPQGWSKCIASD